MQSSNGDPFASSSLPREPKQDLIPAIGIDAPGGSETLEGRPNRLPSSLNIGGMLKALQRHWVLASSLGLVCAAASAAAAWILLPPGKFTARVLLHVDSIPQSVLFHEVHSSANFDLYRQSQIALVKSRLVLMAALRKPEVRELSMIRELEKRGQDEAIDWLERQIKVDFSVGPEILKISLDGDLPEEQKTLVAAIENAYLKEIVQKDHLAAEKHLEDMKKFANGYEDNVKRKRKHLADISKVLGTKDPTALVEIRKFNEAFLNRTKTDLLDVRSDLRRLEEEAVGLSAHPEARELTVSDRAVDEYLKNDPEGKEILSRKQRSEALIWDTQGKLKDPNKNPLMQRFKQEYEGVEAELAARRKSLRPQLVKDLSERTAFDNLLNQDRLKQKIDFLRGWESRLDKDVKRLQKEIADLGTTTLDIEDEKAELARLEVISQRAAHQVEALTVERSAPVRITHLEEAYVTRPNNTRRKLVAAALSGGGALGLVLLVIAWWDFRRQRVNSVDEVVQGLGMRLMGTVPALPSRRQLRLISSNGRGDSRWQSILTESVDTARTLLLHQVTAESLRVIMVTSAVGAEGKTSLSSHLAASLARSGRKTLLLDADLRNSAIHRLFCVDRSPGLCELLRGEVNLVDTIQPTLVPGLSLIPGGRCDELALQSLAQENFGKICEPLRKEFDFIVIDSAPVLPVADSLLVGQFVDGVIFSILHDVSRLPKVYAAHQRLEMLGIRMLGAVVSGAKMDEYCPAYQYRTEVHA
jgi:succinoglycan biosynthesis transport protein ExoP